MHAAIAHLTPILAAEKSKTPFYIAGGVLVAWALIVSLGLGLRESGFPRTAVAARAVMAITAVLVLVAVSMAVVTSGGSTKEAQAASSATNAGTQSGATGGESSAKQPGAASSTGAGAPSTGGTSAPRGAAGANAGKAGKPGSAGAGASSQAHTKLVQAADPSGQLRFAKTSLNAKAGNVTIEFANRSPLPHNLTIASGSTFLGATPTFNGGSKTLTLKLAPGTYKFYCSVPGHREAGMEGTLVVR